MGTFFPRNHLGIRMVWTPETLEIYYPAPRSGSLRDRRPFLTTIELTRYAQQKQEIAQQERLRADRLAAKLQELGITSDELS